MKFGKLALFLGGLLTGTAGISVLKSNDAKKAYTHVTAAVLRGKDSVMKTYTTLKENCGDIHADAVDINEKRYEKAEAAELEKAKAIVAAYENKKQENETQE